MEGQTYNLILRKMKFVLNHVYVCFKENEVCVKT